MRDVCEYLDGVADDPDENIDYDDAIQIGSLCGGRLDRRRDIYLFSYHLDSGDEWSFKVPRAVMDGIADGSIDKLTVDASVPKTVANKDRDRGPDCCGPLPHHLACGSALGGSLPRSKLLQISKRLASPAP